MQAMQLDASNLTIANSWNGILQYDLSDPANPLLSGGYDTPGNAIGVCATDSIVLVADAYALVQLRADIATDVTDPDFPNLPTTFRLSQVYPNPFNPEARIDLSLSNKQTLALTVYNVLGQVVQARALTLSAGIHTLDLHLEDSPSGVYFVQVRSEDFDQTRKMVLMR